MSFMKRLYAARWLTSFSSFGFNWPAESLVSLLPLPEVDARSVSSGLLCSSLPEDVALGISGFILAGSAILCTNMNGKSSPKGYPSRDDNEPTNYQTEVLPMILIM